MYGLLHVIIFVISLNDSQYLHSLHLSYLLLLLSIFTVYFFPSRLHISAFITRL